MGSLSPCSLAPVQAPWSRPLEPLYGMCQHASSALAKVSLHLLQEYMCVIETMPLAVLVALLLMMPAAKAACVSEVKAGCKEGSTDCCGGMSCHPVVNACYPRPRQLKQPCVPGKPPVPFGVCHVRAWYIDGSAHRLAPSSLHYTWEGGLVVDPITY
jgi:hypothetical protein